MNRALNLFFFSLFLLYAFIFWQSLSPYWFNQLYTSDDSLQQQFPLYEFIQPGTFTGDIVTTSMKLYLAPLHYYLSGFITYLTQDPNLAGHWVMLIQVCITCVFFFFAVRKWSATPAAWVSLTWLLHNRKVFQRMTLGLPRGWGPPVIAAYLYFLSQENHWGIIATIGIGCLLNPPAAFLVGASYGFLLALRFLWGLYKKDARRAWENLLRYALCAPLLVLVAAAAVHRPPEIGRMVSYSEALKIPGLSRFGGRFEFVPFLPAAQEIRAIAKQAFMGVEVPWIIPVKQEILTITLIALSLLTLFGLWKRKTFIPPEFLAFLLSSFLVYFAARQFAFYIYVPNRHLQVPVNYFLMGAIPIALWRLGVYLGSPRISGSLLLILVGVLYLLSGTGLQGHANFNTKMTRQGGLYPWLRANTPQTATIAGQPTWIDGVHLMAARKGYITTETAHPFYDKYYAEALRRLEITFRAYYAQDLHEIVRLLEPEHVDYFVFRQWDFLPHVLRRVTYHKPLRRFVQDLAKRGDFAFEKIPPEASYVVYRDSMSTVIDIKKLKESLEESEASAQKRS